MDDCKASTLLPIMEQVCIPGSIIHSDQWKAYRSTNQRFRFAHQTVNHTESFVDPITGAHTQNIVSIWNVCKYHIKQKKGVLGSKMKIMLQEFVWKHNIGKRIDMEALFESIKVI